ncbi:sensor histidine kinase [Streptomyces sp. NBC_00228]|uniref:sensor histidine kinase n=2 Tax=Streptomyces TaxID=1883 RepID=UPI002E2A1390|nr:histidine kinase [Streptomyces sp. NBC_00228]
MDVKMMALDARNRLATIRMWSRRQLAGEATLAVVLALCMAMTQWSKGPLQMVATGLAAAVISLLRRVFPVAALLATGAVSGVLGGFGLVLIVVSWSAGARIETTRRALGWFAATYLLYVGLSVPNPTQPLSAVQTLVFITLSFLVTAVVPALASRNRAQRRTLISALHEHNAQLLREREIIASHARLRERQRIAQDMHDSLGHQLALIAVHTGALEVDRDLTGGQREVVGVLREASVSAMHELREAVGILRDGTPDQQRDHEGELEPQSRGVAGIDGLVEASRGARTVVALRRTGRPRPLAPAADHAAFRIVQEALTNALKHAQGASIAVELRYEPDSLVVEVANGPVPVLTSAVRRPVVSGGQGLTGLQERARLVGGMVHAGPATDGGFRVAGVLPYAPRSPRAAQSVPWPASPEPAEATFVDAASDFRGQSEGVVPGDCDADIDWSGAPDRQKEFDIAMGRKKKGFMIGCGSAVLAFVVLGVLAVVLIVNLVGKEGDKIMLDPKVYESVKVGDSETAVRDKLPHGKSFLGPALKDAAPAEPRGASCSSYLSTKNWPTKGGDMPAFRFCFKDGRLIEKRAFATKS